MSHGASESEALRRMIQDLRTLADHGGDHPGVVLRPAPGGEFVFGAVNKPFLDARGCRREDVEGRTLSRVLGICPEHLRQGLDQAMQGHAVTVRQAPGSPDVPGVSRKACLTPFWNNEGKVEAVLVLQARSQGLDPSARFPGAEGRLYSMLYEQCSEGIMLTTLPGKIRGINPAGADILGYGQDEAVGLDYADLLHPEDSEQAPMRLKSVTEGETVRIQRRLRRKDGTYVPVLLCIQALGPDLVQTLFSDLTQCDQLEERMEKARSLAEEADAAKGEFLAGVSHELRTPITSILGMTEIMLSQGCSSDQQQCLETVKESARALMGIVDDLLDISKIEARKLDLRPEDFDLWRVVEATVRTFSWQAEAKGLAMHLDMAPDVPQRVRQDPGRLGQVLRNLLSNAVKFTNSGEVRVTVETVAKADDSVRLLFAVRDTGIGIAEDQHNKLFKSFSQVNHEISRRYGGTGLGLAISKHLVTMMGGVIWLESRPGAGSAFQFTIRCEPCAGEPSSRDEPAAELGELTVLLVEDNLVNQTFLTHFLAERGHTVITADNGQEALDVLAGREVDVVLMDVQMPVLDGVEATRRIRQGEVQGADPLVPVIALTAYAMEQDRRRFLEVGMNEFLAKPVDLEDLHAAIARQVLRAGADAETASGRGSGQALDLQDREGIEARRKGLGEHSKTFEQMRQGFLKDAPMRLVALEGFLTQGDLEKCGQIAHSLNNSAVAMGARTSADRLRALEHAVRSGHTAEVRALYPEVKAGLEAVLALLRET